jgi:tetratricopeptide (TPR) repeat protein
MLGAMSEDTPERARALAGGGDLQGAAQTLTRYLQATPEDAAAHFQLAHLLLALGDTPAAVQRLQTALALDPDNTTMLSDLGTALEELGDEVQAEQAYRRAALGAPPFPPASYNLALILSRRGQWQEAARHLQTALEQAPDFHAARHQLGLALDALGDEAGARACFDALLAHDAHDIEARRAVAELHAKRCRFAEAAGELEQCLALAPEDSRTILALGACLQELGRVDEALGHYRRLLARDSTRYYEVVKKLTSASTGCFWLKSAELRRVLLG